MNLRSNVPERSGDFRKWSSNWIVQSVATLVLAGLVALVGPIGSNRAAVGDQGVSKPTGLTSQEGFPGAPTAEHRSATRSFSLPSLTPKLTKKKVKVVKKATKKPAKKVTKKPMKNPSMAPAALVAPEALTDLLAPSTDVAVSPTPLPVAQTSTPTPLAQRAWVPIG